MAMMENAVSTLDDILAVLPAVQDEMRADIAARRNAGEHIGRVDRGMVLASRQAQPDAEIAMPRDLDKARQDVIAQAKFPPVKVTAENMPANARVVKGYYMIPRDQYNHQFGQLVDQLTLIQSAVRLATSSRAMFMPRHLKAFRQLKRANLALDEFMRRLHTEFGRTD